MVDSGCREVLFQGSVGFRVHSGFSGVEGSGFQGSVGFRVQGSRVGEMERRSTSSSTTRIRTEREFCIDNLLVRIIDTDKGSLIPLKDTDKCSLIPLNTYGRPYPLLQNRTPPYPVGRVRPDSGLKGL